MNFDDFEKKLQGQPMRDIPGHWRGEILAAATPTPEKGAWWREWLWPCPQAWVGLAAVWIVILGVQLASRTPSMGLPAPLNPRVSVQELAELREHQIMFAGWPALLETATKPDPQPALSPRSERRLKQFRA